MSSISIENLCFSYDKKHKVLENISFDIDNGEAVAIVGANGAGKSTLLRLLVGLEFADSGRICVNGISIAKKNLTEIRACLGYVFQDAQSQLFMPTVFEDIAFAPRNHKLSEAEVSERVEKALEQTGISHLKNRRTFKLSGGEQKLASIASVLSMNPQIILMDEPTIALDPKNRRRLINILNSLNQIKIISSHDLDMVLDTCSRVILLKDGKIAADGRSAEILSDKELLESCSLELPLTLQQR